MPQDPHQGGCLEDMAAEGTTIPGDAGKQRLGSCTFILDFYVLIPSVPRPDQIDPPANQAHADPAHAVDNAFDIPRSVNDRGQTGEILSGTGDQLSSNIEKKNLDDTNFDDRAKGHDRYAKHVRQDNPLDSNKHGTSSHNVEAAQGEELLSQNELLDERGAQ